MTASAQQTIEKLVEDLQPATQRVVQTLVAGKGVAQSYLFVGPAGSEKKQAALALACWLMGNDESADLGPAYRIDDTRSAIARGVHPDVHVLEPEGVSNYVVEQIRETIDMVARAPIRAHHKVIILTAAEALNAASANAFLKTLEEPPANCLIILLANSPEAVLPTLVSRCQVVSFASPAARVVIDKLQACGFDTKNATSAYYLMDGCYEDALAFLQNPSRVALRAKTVALFASLPRCGSWEVVKACTGLAADCKEAGKALEDSWEDSRDELKEFLTSVSERALEAKTKRAIAASKAMLFADIVATCKLLVGDVSFALSGASVEARCPDAAQAVSQAASVTNLSRCGQAQALCSKAASQLKYNVNPETCLDALFLGLKEVLYGSGSTRETFI